MNPFIKSINLNLFNGILKEEIEFSSALNLISGVNGTGKTSLLKELKGKSGISVSPEDGRDALRIQAISPKRNSVRRSLVDIVNTFKRKDRSYPKYLAERLNAALEDNTFQEYPSFSEVFYYLYEDQHISGDKTPEQCVAIVEDELNTVISSVFGGYDLNAQWNQETNAPDLKLIKYGSAVPLESLSSGEQEIMSLITNLYASKESTDVFLIDEPEIHLNWDLEKQLFKYLLEFSEVHGKQLIVSTHSRIVFHDEFSDHSSFLHWQGEQIKWASSALEDQRIKIAGEAFNIVNLSDVRTLTLFVEDSFHEAVVDMLSKIKGTKVEVFLLRTSSGVKNTFRIYKDGVEGKNAYFMIDGDNQPNEFKSESHFIHLDKYCLENYFLDPRIIARVAGKTEKQIKDILLTLIHEKAAKVSKRNRLFERALMKLARNDVESDLLDTYDGSILFEPLLKSLKIRKSKFLKDYIVHCEEKGILNETLPERLVELFELPTARKSI